MDSFTGGCEPLASIGVQDLIDWVGSINREMWPDWHKNDWRPAVVNAPDWENLKGNTQRVVSELLALFPGCHDTYRSITTTHPGDYVPPHIDDMVPNWVTRIHIPITTNPDAFFMIDGVDYHLKVGMAYQVNPRKPHAVRNGGKTSRIHLMFDVVR